MTTDPDRPRPRFGGFNRTALSLDIRRVLRNRRTLIFVQVIPAAFFLVFSSSARNAGPPGTNSGLTYLMISMAVYGAMMGTTAGGAAVSVERSLGWSRQLRLTPLRPMAYVAMKVLTAMTIGLLAIVTEFAVGAVFGVRAAASVWVLSGVGAWLSSFVFAAFGLFMGFLLPSENVMQFLGPALAIMAAFGGLFVPIQMLPPAMQTAAKFTPVYGVGQIARAPLVGGLTITAVASVAVWSLLFGIGAMYLFRRDTARV